MKKKLDVTAFTSSLRGESVFFPQSTADQPDQQEQTSLPTPQPSQTTTQKEAVLPDDTVIPRYHDTTIEPVIPRTHDTMTPQSEDEVIEIVRKAVKQIGKEGATQRLTIEEKQALADIEYSYKRQGIRTSGNEIIRIALNFAVEDYQKNGEHSILAKVLKRLNS